MVRKTSTFTSSFVLPFILVTTTYMSEASLLEDQYNIIRISSINSLSRTRQDSSKSYYPTGPWIRMETSPPPPPPICRPETLDPSVECGCAVFRDDYEGEEQFALLEEGCNGELEGDIPSGFASCAEPSFAGTTFENQSFVNRIGGIRVGLLRNFLKVARDDCAFTPAPLPPPEVRQSTHEVSVLGEDPRMDISREGTEKWNFDRDSAVSPVSRIPSRAAHMRVRDLCMIVLSRMRKDRKMSFCVCCPRHPSCRRRRSTSPR